MFQELKKNHSITHLAKKGNSGLHNDRSIKLDLFETVKVKRYLLTVFPSKMDMVDSKEYLTY